MSILRIGSVDFTYSIKNESNTLQIPEFFIDDQPLIELLGECRDLGNCDNDLNNGLVSAHSYILQLLGQVSKSNQFGSNRLVLYRCHCGCDYCGIFSTEIAFEEQTVQWNMIAWEDEDNQTVFDSAIHLSFSKPQYINTIEQYCEQAGIAI